MNDIRSRRCIFVAHCLLAQGVMANGVVRHFPGPVRPILEFCLEHDLNIMQMPCPETRCPAGGLGRVPRGKQWYEKNGLRETAREIAQDQADYMRKVADNGFEILAIIGVDFSPACAVNYLNRGTAIYRDQGIYVEELREALAARDLSIRFVGINQRWHKKLRRDLEGLIEKSQSSDPNSGGRIAV